jgi:hypothetical protein
MNLTDKNVESMPSLFQDIIERMAASQVMSVKPDACIVDFYNEVASCMFFFFFLEGGEYMGNLVRYQICKRNTLSILQLSIG